MENSITYNFKFTISKVAGIIIIFGGIALGFYLKSESVAVTLVTVGAGLIAVKTVTSRKDGLNVK